MGLDFRILGDLEVRQEGDPIDLGSPGQRTLLARLLISRGESITIDRLVEDLWQGNPPETSQHVIATYVSGLRKALGVDGDRLERRGAGYRVRIERGELDAHRFEQLTARGRAALARGDAEQARVLLGEALSLWRGRAFGVLADDAFAEAAVAGLDQARLATLEQRIWADLELGRHSEAVEELENLVVQHPFREVFWEQLMLSLYRSGRQAEALRAYQRARVGLARELGIEPGPALRSMEERILAQDPGLAPNNGPGVGGPRIELPLERTSFVARTRELLLAADLLEHSRLLTLTGAPGSGKTRLALRLAANHADDFPHGVFFVPLSAVTEPRFVGSNIARVLGVRDLPGESVLDAISTFLENRQALLVLDNFEQVLRAAPQVAALLDAAPELKIIVTSRAPLGLAGEQELLVPPLSVPPVSEPIELEEVEGYDAITLFVERARAVDANFEITAANATVVGGITARLDGLPLAIELAAARVKLLPPQDILARLEKRLAVLTGGPTDADSRHRTLRGAIAWSYDLLAPDEQKLFRRLGVFRGFTLETAKAVTGLAETEVFDGVDSLLTRSLLYRLDTPGEARFAQLETIRELALEELASAEEERDATRRLAEYFCSLAEAIEPQLTQESQEAALDVLAQEQENIRSALRFAIDAHEPTLGLQLTGCIWRFWQSSGQLLEGRQWLERLLELPGATPEARMKGLTGLAGLAYWQADYDQAWTLYSELLDLSRAIGDRANEADTLFSLSMTASWKGHPDTAGRLADEAGRVFEELGSGEGIGRTLLARGLSRLKSNDLPAALQHYQDAHAIARETHHPALALSILLGVAAISFQLGERSVAKQIILETVDEAAALGNAQITVWALDCAAAMGAHTAPEDSARLGGAVESLRQQAGGGMLPESIGLESARCVVERLLGPKILERSWTQGRDLSLDDAVALAHRLGGSRSEHEPAD